MKVRVTNIPDIDVRNIDQSKVKFADRILSGIYPMFDDVFIGKKKRVKELQTSLKEKKKQVVRNKEALEENIAAYKKKKKIARLLNRIEKLVSSGLVKHGGMRNEIVVLLKIIGNLSEEKLDFHTKQIITTLNKRFVQSS